MKIQIIDLFAGIGGFSLAAHWMGWETALFCEIEGFPQKVLTKNFPEVPIHGDIRTLSYEKAIKYGWQPEQPTIITGGFPCQPFSTAGKRNGTNDDRFLWPEMLRVIREIQPTWIIGENVAGIVSMEDGRTLERILNEVEGEGYQVQAFLIPACGVGAIHRRDRVWIVANATKGTNTKQPKKNRFRENRYVSNNGSKQFNTNPNEKGLQGSIKQNGSEREEQFNKQPHRCNRKHLWWPTQSPVCGKNDGVPVRMDGYKLTRNQHRAERLKSLGNAIVPQVAYEIFKAIEQSELFP